MSFRIRKVEKGYIVEKSKKMYGFTIWEPFVKSTGLDCAWHHSTIEYAMMNLLDEVKKNVIIIE